MFGSAFHFYLNEKKIMPAKIALEILTCKLKTLLIF